MPVNPSDDDDTTADPVPWVEASLTEEWMCSVYGPPKGKWRAIAFDMG